MGGLFMGLSAVLGGINQIQQGYAQAEMMNLQAQQEMLQGQAVMSDANIKASMQKQEALKLMSKQIAQGAGAGVDVTSSTSSLSAIIDDSQKQAANERELMLQQARVESANRTVAAASYQGAAKQYKRQGLISGITTAVGGLATAGAFDGFSNIFRTTTPSAMSLGPKGAMGMKSIPKW